jgi:flagellin
MSLRINFNLASVFAHQNLRGVDRLLEKSLDRLSSGERIRRAGDDPAAMVLANNLRHHLSGIQQATQNSEEGVTMVQTAEGAVDEMSALLTRMRTLAIEAANGGVQDSFSLAVLQAELDNAIGNITRIATDTRFGNIPLLQGQLSGNTITQSDRRTLETVRHDLTNLPGGIQDDSVMTTTLAAPVSLTRSTVSVTLTGAVSPLPGTTVVQGLNQNGTVLDAVDGTSFTLSGPLGNRTFTLPTGATIDDVVAQVNAFTDQIGARAGYDPNTGQLTIESTAFGNSTLGITSADMTSGAVGVGLFDSDTTTVANTFVTPAANQTVQFTYFDAAGTSRTLTLTQDPTSPGGRTFTNLAGGPEAVAPFTAFDPGAFSVTFQDTSGDTFGSTLTIAAGSYTATRTSTTFIQTGAKANQITILDIPDMRAGALGHTAGLAASGFANLQDLITQSALTTGNTTEALAVIDAAINEVSGTRGKAGAIQANALEASLSTLRTSFENLTSAESTLRDTDFAAESAAYARHNIIYQAATAMLAQANQIPQTILQMLR